MARVTVEDCVEVIPNRFELVALAAQRGKQIASGAPLTLDRDNDKDAVVALREVAEQTVDLAVIEQEVISSYSTYKMSESVQVEASEEGAENEANVSSEINEAFDEVQLNSDAQQNDVENNMSFVGMDEEVDD